MSSISHLTSPTAFPRQSLSQLQQGLQEFQALTDSLSSGNIAGAQAACAKMRQEDPNFIPPGTSPADFANLTMNLASGNLQGAQTALSTIQSNSSSTDSQSGSGAYSSSSGYSTAPNLWKNVGNPPAPSSDAAHVGNSTGSTFSYTV